MSSLEQLADNLAAKNQPYEKDPSGALTWFETIGDLQYDITVWEFEPGWARAQISIPVSAEIEHIDDLVKLVSHWYKDRVNLAFIERGEVAELWVHANLLLSAIEPELEYLIFVCRNLIPFLMKIAEDGNWERDVRLGFEKAAGRA